MAVSLSDRVKAAPDVLFRLVGDEGVLLNLKTERYLGVNPIGARIWSVLEGGATVQDAYDTLLREYEVDPAQLRQDLDRFIGELLVHALIEPADGSSRAPA